MIAFVHVAKTGGRSVENMLRSSFGMKHCDGVRLRPRPVQKPDSKNFTIPKYSADDVSLLKGIMPEMKSLSGHQVALWSGIEEVFPEVRFLILLRDPLKRGASHYQYHVNHDDYTQSHGVKHFSWERWVDWEVHHNHQLKMLSATVDLDDAIGLLGRENTFVGLMERFDESMLLFNRLRAAELNIAYRRKNSAQDNSLAQSLLEDPRATAQIREMYAKEFPLYDYVKNDLFPQYVREYGPTLDSDLAQYRKSVAKGVNYFNLMGYHCYRRLKLMPKIRKLRSSLT